MVMAPNVPDLAMDQARLAFPSLTFVNKIGVGGQKQVFRAVDQDGLKVVAKFVQIDYFWVDDVTVMQNTEAETRTWREIGLMRRYSSQYLPSLYPDEPRVVDFAGLRYICYAENHAGKDSVADLLRSDGTLSEVSVIKLVHDVAAALSLYHFDKIVHRDVKPQNIVFDDERDCFVLIDGGVHLAPGNATITHGYVPGTQAYYSPEQARGERRGLDCRSDQFSLGITAYEALTGSNPFAIDATDFLQFDNNRANAIYRVLDSARFSERTIHLVQKLLQKHPHNRFRDPERLLSELEGIGE